MGNTDDKKVDMNKTIPRNPNTPVSDDEIKKLLQKASEQIAEKEEGKSSDKKSETASKEASAKASEKKDVVIGEKERENIDLNARKKIAAEKEKLEEAKREVEKAKLEEAARKIAEDKKKKDAVAKKVAEDRQKTEDAMKKLAEDKKKEAAEKKSAEKSKKEDREKKPADLPKKEDVEKKSMDKSGDNNKVKKDNEPLLDFKVEDDVYVTSRKAPIVKNYKLTVGDVIGGIFEGIWTTVKLMVIVLIATALVGFFLSRDLMIRGRSGEQISKQGMSVAAQALSGKTSTKKEAKLWSQEMDFEKLTMETDDGKILVARQYVVNKNGDDWVVILHGQNGSMEDIYDIAFRYSEEGYNVLMPDLRANGESEGSYYGMGWLDRLDVINWIDVVLEEYPSANIAIHGVDLGAATALMLSGEPLKDSIKVIVAEGAYTTAWDVVKKEYKARHEDWPAFPAVHMLSAVAKVWGGYSLTEANAVEQVKKTSVPILLIQGKNDTYVTPEMTEELNQAIASEHQMVTIATGTHEDCRFAEPDTYYAAVFDFVEKYMTNTK